MHKKSLLPSFSSGKNKLWGPSDLQVVFEIFSKLKLGKYKSFADLGSGDGRVANMASLFTKAQGYETNKYLANIGKRTARRFLLPSKFNNKNFKHADLSQYDFIFIYPDKDYNLPDNNWLLNKIEAEFKGTLVVYKVYPLKFECIRLTLHDIPTFIYNMGGKKMAEETKPEEKKEDVKQEPKPEASQQAPEQKATEAAKEPEAKPEEQEKEKPAEDKPA